MEKPTNVVTLGRGGLRLPVGFRFCPTDLELVAYYLKRKAFNLPLPASVILDLDAPRLDPSDLPGDSKEKRYFFANRKWNSNKCDRICKTRSGCWKRLGKPTAIVAPGTNLAIGSKRTRAFYQGKRRHAARTPWVMHEFRLLGSHSNPCSSQKLGDWAVYCIFQKNRRCSRRNSVVPEALCSHGRVGDAVEEIKVGEDGSDFGPPQPSSSSSSSSSKNGLEGQEESSNPHYIGCF